ncbi:MAG: hypothetical protein EBS84_22820, partial [Proteobacteria bacterium]|nr:hypothetical protein [Pseudomonadota bacterium]
KATSYAILRKGRSLQLLDKRFEAIKIYQEVLDFFPNDIKYAAPALYLIGVLLLLPICEFSEALVQQF